MIGWRGEKNVRLRVRFSPAWRPFFLYNDLRLPITTYLLPESGLVYNKTLGFYFLKLYALFCHDCIIGVILDQNFTSLFWTFRLV